MTNEAMGRQRKLLKEQASDRFGMKSSSPSSSSNSGSTSKMIVFWSSMSSVILLTLSCIHMIRIVIPSVIPSHKQEPEINFDHPYRKSGPIIQPNIGLNFYTNHSYYHDIIPEGTKLLSTDESNRINIEYPDLTAIIHIGPIMTGSSSLQASFRDVFRTSDPKNDSDNYIGVTQYIKRHNSNLVVGNIVGCFRDPRAENYDYMTCEPEMLPKIHDLASIHHHNLIISADFLASPDTNIPAIKEFLSPWKKHRVVAYYRRYYDWLNSFHSQVAKKFTTPDRQKLTDYLSSESKTQYWWNRMYITASIQRWKEHFHDIHVINIYESPAGDALDSFYCSALINATKSCNTFRKQKERSLAKTTTKQVIVPSVALIYEDLAYYAKEMNLWSETSTTSNNKSLTIQGVSNKIQHYQEKILGLTQFDFGVAMECPPYEVSQYLLHQTLDTEKSLFPQFFHEVGEQQIRNEFALQIQTTLCHINPNTILEQKNRNGTIWNHFFTKILPIT